VEEDSGESLTTYDGFGEWICAFVLNTYASFLLFDKLSRALLCVEIYSRVVDGVMT
jgi:hypothetical protein